MEPFRALLKERLRDRGALARLARQSGLSPTLIGRWERGETRPSDTNLRKLAPSIGVAYEDLLRMCGYLPDGVDRELDPVEAEVRATVPEMQEALSGIPRIMWATVLSASRRSAVDTAKAMARLLAEAGTVTGREPVEITEIAAAPNDADDGSERELSKHYHVPGLRGPVRVAEIVTPSALDTRRAGVPVAAVL